MFPTPSYCELSMLSRALQPSLNGRQSPRVSLKFRCWAHGCVFRRKPPLSIIRVIVLNTLIRVRQRELASNSQSRCEIGRIGWTNKDTSQETPSSVNDYSIGPKAVCRRKIVVRANEPPATDQPSPLCK